MRVETFIFSFALLALAASGSSAQNMPQDSGLYSNSVKHVIDYYNVAIGNGSEIYNGPVYELNAPANKGSFYFQDKNYAIPALIRYNGTWYKNVPVLYDVHSDVMVSTQGNNLFVLNTGKLSEVYLLEHHFIYVDDIPVNNALPGYYDLLYTGKVQVLVKRAKLIDDHITASQREEVFYEDKRTIYIKKNDKYYLVDSMHALTDVFKDKKNEVNLYIKDNNTDFKMNPEGAAVKLAGYYDSLNN